MLFCFYNYDITNYVFVPERQDNRKYLCDNLMYAK
jgi:hypothetical protein